MTREKMILGAIAGDVIGSVYEWHNVKSMNFNLFSPKSTFTDDSVLTIATMDVLINKEDYAEVYQKYGRKYFGKGYGSNFRSWIYSNNPKPYNSWGNGSAMRVSPVGWFCTNMEDVLQEAKRSAEVTHNHPEGIKGAQAAASAVFLARNGKTKNEIKDFITGTFNYDLERSIDEIRPDYNFVVSCQGSVPEAIIAFLESTDYENAIRLAVSIGGDSDTIACITGGIAEAFYGKIPDNIIDNVSGILTTELKNIIKIFSEKYGK